MPNPKRKFTRARRDSRRAKNWTLVENNLSRCSHCGALRPSHRVCPSCGFYNGKIVVVAKTKKGKGPEGGGEQKPE